jgi:exopolysaccharide biosynthesis polyprenyl glycosylphosphotransferase
MTLGEKQPATDVSRRPRPALLARQVLMRQALAVCDAIVIAAAFVIAWWFVATGWSRSLAPLAPQLWLLWVIIPAWLGSLRFFDLYSSSSFARAHDLVGSLIRMQIVAGLLLLSSMYIIRASWVSRMLMQSFLATSFLMLLAYRLAVRAIVNRYRRRISFHRPRILMISTPRDAQGYLSMVARHASMTAEIAGMLLPAAAANASGGPSPPILGVLKDLPMVLQAHVIDEVVVTTPLDRASLDSLAMACAVRGLVMRMMLEVPAATVGAWHADDLGQGAFMLTLSAVPHDALALAAKRAVDIAGSIAGLAVCLVAWAIYGPRLRSETGSTIFFPQTRIGRNGRRFVLYKFRTMHRDAEQRLGELRVNNHMNGPMFKLPDDPRVTETGRVLRRRHLDELPQFWNALKGEMSLVGTRPPTEDEVARYREHHLRRLSMKPGITGLWQVEGNDHVNDFEDVVRLDCEYIDKWSLRMDLRILVKTVKKILRADAW